MLVVTPWLVRRGRPELTLEHEIGQPRWSGLFTDEERAEAARRQARAGPDAAQAKGLAESETCARARCDSPARSISSTPSTTGKIRPSRTSRAAASSPMLNRSAKCWASQFPHSSLDS